MKQKYKIKSTKQVLCAKKLDFVNKMGFLLKTFRCSQAFPVIYRLKSSSHPAIVHFETPEKLLNLHNFFPR